tara:strand:+ start:434 stop:1153 length:720 start_codon:yes stop_codon:yes gene_type:complete
MKSDLLKEIIKLVNDKVAFCTFSEVESDDVEIVLPDDSNDTEKQKFIKETLTRDYLQIVKIENKDFIINPYNPPLKLIIVGAVHISQYLSKIAKLLDFDVTIVDPREAFASQERFPNDNVINLWPEECFDQLEINSRTAIVTLTHEPDLDDPALNYALNSNCFYVGALGSKKTHSNRLKRLKKQKFSNKDLKRINGPIGLPINASKPNEIAISIMSEIIASLRHHDFLNTELRDDWKLR